ncbi:MAG TPA: RNA ligase family protein, partial [Nitrosopumilaceae archaeon]|nr:RNA ligase family protein [Nitrosopumilaceae archaeon]
WQLLKNDLKGFEIFGENMYGIHSIAYSKLESFYYVFAIRDNKRWLSWEEVAFYAAVLDFPTVPKIEITVPLNTFYRNTIDDYRDILDENKLLSDWFIANLGMSWEDSVETPGKLGGFDPETGKACSEGFVVRNQDSFFTNEGIIPTASNEFNNLFKLVRKKHVKTDKHWTKTWKQAVLVGGQKYGWYGYDKILQKIK